MGTKIHAATTEIGLEFPGFSGLFHKHYSLNLAVVLQFAQRIVWIVI